jgi:DNA primase
VKDVLNEIKERLVENSDKLVELLEEFGFEHINHRGNEIRFARDLQGGSNISIRLKNNPYCVVFDWSRGVTTDIISYIIQEKSVEFKDVLRATKKILGLGNDWRPQQKKALFGGIYDNIARLNREIQLKTYDEAVLDKYEKCGSLRFLRDGISLNAQKFWNVRFSIEDNRIIIPIRNEYSEIVGAKGRLNGDADEENPKYLYTIPVAMSQLLYGYSENYQYLYGNDVILVESEKSVMQAWDFGVRNIVALGSHSLSEKQTKLLLQLQPKKIIIAMDEGLGFEHTKRNADMIKNLSGMLAPEIWYWDSTQDLDIGLKCSPTDMGKEKFEEFMNEQLIKIY